MPRKSHHAASSGAGVGAFDTVGFVEGAAVGVDDGADDGTAVGTAVGTWVGAGTGIGVGCGVIVGADDGVAVGSAVGSDVGSDVGTALGAALGAADGAVVCACATATSSTKPGSRRISSSRACHLRMIPMAFVVGQPTATEPNATTASNPRRIGYRLAVTNGVLATAADACGLRRWAYNASQAFSS